MSAISTKLIKSAGEMFGKKSDSWPVRILFVLFAILPIVDSLNGLINQGGNEGLFSLGVVYRALVCLICLFVIGQSHPKIKTIVLYIILVSILLIPHLFQLTNSTYLMLVVKTLLPILCIEALTRMGEPSRNINVLHTLIRIWSVLFPLAVIIPELLGGGFQTYRYELIGYKGFFYAQNDLCFVLVILFFFACKGALQDLSPYYALALVLNGLCLLQLGLKGGYVLAFLSLIYWAVHNRVPKKWKTKVIIGLILVCLVSLFILSDVVMGIFGRWSYFLRNSDSLVTFFWSGRIDRVPIAINYLNETYGWLSWLPFGSGLSYVSSIAPAGLIEIDPVDILLQFGIFGLGALSLYYGSIIKLRIPQDSRYLQIAASIAILMSLTAGHVFNTALSGMVLGVVLGLVRLTGKSVLSEDVSDSSTCIK